MNEPKKYEPRKHVGVGERFGKLVVMGKEQPTEKGKGRWKCRCDCGNFITTRHDNLTQGRTQSCGCLAREASIKHLEKARALNSQVNCELRNEIGLLKKKISELEAENAKLKGRVSRE